MNVERVALEALPVEAYDRLARDSFFLSRGFLELWRWKGGRPVAWVAWVDGAIAAALPGVEYGFGPARRFASLPDGCYGGLLTDAALNGDRSRLATVVVAALTRGGYAKTSVFDYDGTLASPAGFEPLPCEARVIEIGDPNWRPPDRKLQSQARKAAREGIRVEPFDWERHGERFLRLARITARRHRARVRYTPGFYRALAALARRDDRVVWAWCEHQGAPVCSHIYFVEHDALQAWQSYFDKRFSFLKPNAYVRIAMACAAARRGIRRLNLGSTPESAVGLAYYKARWGGALVCYRGWQRWDGLGRVATALRRPGNAHAAPVPAPHAS